MLVPIVIAGEIFSPTSIIWSLSRFIAWARSAILLFVFFAAISIAFSDPVTAFVYRLISSFAWIKTSAIFACSTPNIFAEDSPLAILVSSSSRAWFISKVPVLKPICFSFNFSKTLSRLLPAMLASLNLGATASISPTAWFVCIPIK